jgi:hypothetical protein
MAWQVLDGRIDVLEALQAIPAERVRHMQHTIARFAERMHYALDDTPGDALEVLLNELARGADAAEQSPSDVRTICEDYRPDQGRWPHVFKPCDELRRDGMSCADGTLQSKRVQLRMSDVCQATCGRCHS